MDYLNTSDSFDLAWGRLYTDTQA